MTMLNEQAQERFMRLWADVQPAVANYIHAVLRDPVAAKDLVQETALVAFPVRIADGMSSSCSCFCSASR